MTHPVLGISAENTAGLAAPLLTHEESDPVLGQKQLSETAGPRWTGEAWQSVANSQEPPDPESRGGLILILYWRGAGVSVH